MAEDSPFGFICKGCGEFFTNQAVEHWDVKYGEITETGQRRVLELILECPSCRGCHTYHPDESKFQE
jgi:hypothetical protein